MASFVSDQSNSNVTSVGNSGLVTRNRKIRVVAKVRGFTESEIASGASKTSVQVIKPNGDESDRVTISFGERADGRKENYELDFCYEHNDRNELIFSREVKPLIRGIFYGCDATIIANGARGSGKTCLIQGNDEIPGLVALALAEILSLAEENEKSVSISFYEVYNEQVYDMLDQEHRTVSVFEDARRKIQLKGLSQVPLKSMSEYFNIYISDCGSRKSLKKTPNEVPRRSHRGLMIQVSSHGESGETVLVGKMNFVDMSGYEDARRKITDGTNLVKNGNINKSLYALHNVINAFNGNEIRVPYRESKLTHMLQDSLGGLSRILMVVCLNPFFCQDSIYMVNLASRSFLGYNRTASDCTKKTKSLLRTTPSSNKNKMTSSISTSVKKSTASRNQFSGRKGNGIEPVIKGRKLFEESQLPESEKIAMQSSSSSDIAPKVEASVRKEGTQISNVVEPSLSTVLDHSVDGENNIEKVIPTASDNKNTMSVEEGHNIHKENDSSIANVSESPPLSSKLQELSNKLKLLQASTPSRIQMPTPVSTGVPASPLTSQILEENDSAHNSLLSAKTMEPKTPQPTVGITEVLDINSPWERFSKHGSAMKNTLVQEYLKFLNTAEKEDLKRLKGIGEKRATNIVQLRQETPEPFKSLDDIQDIGLSAKQIKKMMKSELSELMD